MFSTFISSSELMSVTLTNELRDVDRLASGFTVLAPTSKDKNTDTEQQK